MAQQLEIEERWRCFVPLLSRPSPFAHPNFEHDDPDNFRCITDSRVLVVGAGGLGCELLKSFAMSGFKDIHCIDLDTIDVSNLNRQFLFRKNDIGKYKSEVAAERIMQRMPGCTVRAYTKPIQEFSRHWYTQFNLVVAGLDNIEARRWLNETVVDLAKFDRDGNLLMETMIPLIDGGTEGFDGQSRVFLPHVTSCFECGLDSLTPPKGYQMCTIANVPRIPEHCIAYVLKKLWPQLQSFLDHKTYVMQPSASGAVDSGPGTPDEDSGAEDQGAVKLDRDNVEHMTWLFERAAERARQFGITGVTYSLTMSVVKNIIPAIGSTNAFISAECVNEAFKILTGCRVTLNNYWMFIGSGNGVNSQTFPYQRKPDCPVCRRPLFVELSGDAPLSELVAIVEEEGRLAPGSTASTAKQGIILSSIPGYEFTKARMEQPIKDFMQHGTMCHFSDKYEKQLKVWVRFQGELLEEEQQMEQDEDQEA